jgi:hypothetical protein
MQFFPFPCHPVPLSPNIDFFNYIS